MALLDGETIRRIDRKKELWGFWLLFSPVVCNDDYRREGSRGRKVTLGSRGHVDKKVLTIILVVALL